MALEIYDLGSTISILNDGEYTIITKQDASIELNGPYVALIDFTGQRYEYNFADVTVPSEVSGQALAETLNTYLQSSGGGGGSGDTVTGRDVTTLSATSKKVNDFTSAQVVTNAADTYSLTLASTTSANHYLFVQTASGDPFIDVTVTSYASPKDGAILVMKLNRAGTDNLNIPGFASASGFSAGVYTARYSSSLAIWAPVNYLPFSSVQSVSGSNVDNSDPNNPIVEDSLQAAYDGGNTVNGVDVILEGLSSILAIGNNASDSNVGSNIVAIGNSASQFNAGNNVISIGTYSAQGNLGGNIIAAGYNSALGNEGGYVIALGYNAGKENKLTGKVIIGNTELPTYADHAAATAAITLLLGASSGSTYLYHNQATNSIGAVRL